MKRKIFVIIIMLVITTSTFMIAPTDLKMEVSGEGGDIELDYELIKYVTWRLSEIVHDVKSEGLDKGRAFGSDGERIAANFIEDRMEINCSISSVNAFQDKIKSRWYPGMKIFRTWNLDSKLVIKSRGISAYNTSESKTYSAGNDCYISPRWEGAVNKNFEKDELSDNFSYTNLKVHQFPTSIEEWFSGYFLDWESDNISQITVISIIPSGSVIDFILSGIEQYYDDTDFTFKGLNSSDNTTWPSFYEPTNYIDDYVYIMENPTHNPNKQIPAYKQHIKNLTKQYPNIQKLIFKIIDFAQNYILYKLEKCRGIIRYDFNVDTYDMNLHINQPLPYLYINKSLGNKIKQDIENHTINFHIDQEWKNEDVESYNVIGEISGVNNNRVVIVSCFYDSWWCEGTADSAIGMGIILAIAKYLKELKDFGITPKYKVKFIAFSGEEYGRIGSKYYESQHSILSGNYEYVDTIIDLNQLGFSQPPGKPDLTLQLWTNDNDIRTKLQKIGNNVNYEDRTDTKLTCESDLIFGGPPGNQNAFATWRLLTKTVYLLKDTGWVLHHRDGKEHTKGDVRSHYDSNDTNTTAELVLNITKYFTINPDCWLDGNPTYITYDDDNNNVPDRVDVTFTVKTNMPKEKIYVRTSLTPDSYFYHSPTSTVMSVKRGAVKILKKIACYSLEEDISNQKYYYITPDGITDTLTISLIPSSPNDWYTLQVSVFNSTGIIDWKPCSTWSERIKFGPPDDPPEIDGPLEPVGSPIVISEGDNKEALCVLKMNASDSNNDSVEYQIKFTGSNGIIEYSNWTKPQLPSVNHTQSFKWTPQEDVTKVQVRARDIHHSPNLSSNWSDPINLTLNPGCWAQISPWVEVLNQNIEFDSIEYDIPNVDSWFWDFDDETNSTQETTTHSFSQIGNYTVNLSVTDTNNTVYYYEAIVRIVNIKADFNVSSNSVKPNETVYFNDNSQSSNTIVNWSWNFSDGNTSWDQNTSHNYTTDGEYNVTLTVKDNMNNTDSCYEIIHVDSIPPEIIPTPEPYYPIGLGYNVTLYADFFDDNSGVSMAKINITNPDNSYGNYTMNPSENSIYDFEYVFNDTWQIGQYIYNFWVVDNANNTNTSTNRSFNVCNIFGNIENGSMNQSINDRITGSAFTIYEDGTADYISAYIQTNLSPSPKSKCMIYRVNDSKLIGTTNEITPNTGNNPEWTRYNFSGTKPLLKKNTEYVLTCWSNNSCYLYYENSTSNSSGKYKNMTYGSPPSQLNWTSNESRGYSICCVYSTKPFINDVSNSPDIVGLGFNQVNITANVSHNASGVSLVKINITHPDNTYENYSMENIGNDTYKYTHYESWLVGQYNYTICAYDRMGRSNSSSGHSFNVSANTTIKICTLYDNYTGNKTINITDPPVNGDGGKFNGNYIVDRGETWNTYYDNESDEYQLAIYPSVVNYKNDTGVYNPINTTIISKSLTISGQQYQYGVDRGIYEAYWKEQSSDTNLKPVTMVYDKYTVTLSPRDYITFIPHKSGNQGLVGNRVQSNAIIDSNSIKYPGQYQCIGSSNDFADLEYEYQPLRVKENLVIFNQSYLSDLFDILCNSSDAEKVNLTFSTIVRAYNTSDVDSNTLGIVYGDSCTSFKEYGMVGGDDIITDEEIYFTNDQNNTVFFIPKLYVIDSNGSSILLSKTVSMTDFGNINIDILTPWSWLNSSDRVFPVFIDPTIQYDADTGDGWAREGPDTNWSTVRDGSGSYSSDDDNSEYGVRIQKLILDSDYYISRAFFRFNTSGLPDESVITGASVKIRGCYIKPPPFVVSSGVVFQKWTGGGTVSNGDYNDFSGSMYGSLGSWSTTGWNTIPWQYNINEISKTGDTDICVRNWEYDYNDSAPSPESGDWGSSMYFADSSNDPYLIISYQYPPAYSNPLPADGASGVPLCPTVAITVTDTDNSTMNLTWYNKINDAWQVFGTNNSVLNGTYRQIYSNASVNGQWWEWKVNITDNVTSKETSVFKFYTGNQSKINNTGSYNISGFLTIRIEYYNLTSAEWDIDLDVINESSPRFINTSVELGLDTIFNGLANTSNFTCGNGTYRVYAALRDPYWNVLVCDDQTKIEASYDFEVTY